MDGFNLYYSDTDSIDIDKPLPDKDVGVELEHIFQEAVYLAPQVYGGITSTYEYIKIKGLKKPIPYSEFKSLLKRGFTLEATNQKWYINLSMGNLTIKDEIYTLSMTETKRTPIYDEHDNFIGGKPFIL